MPKRLTYPTFDEEKKLWQIGYQFVMGTDEVGRGSFAGPVVAAAVVFKKGSNLPTSLFGVNDSKLLAPAKREYLAREIKNTCLFWNIAVIQVGQINKFGIGKATDMAFRKAVKSIMYQVLSIKQNGKNTVPNTMFYVLSDAFYIKYIRGIGLKNQKAIIKGDQKSISIASASIIAKVYRDELMTKLSSKFPEYKFAIHKGYGTKEHRVALKKHGLSKIHRTSFLIQKYTS